MRFWIAKDPSVAMILIPWFVPTDQTREEIYLELRHRLTHNPEETFVCVAIEGDTIQGFIAAYCRYDDVYLWQGRARSPFDNLYPSHIAERSSMEAMQGLEFWAKGCGYNKIVSNSPEGARHIMKRYGYCMQPDGLIAKEI